MTRMTQSPRVVLWPGVPPEPFHGWRYRRRTLPDGGEVVEQTPLTYEELLDPQEGDEIPENTYHEQERGDLARILRARLPASRRAQVFSDLIINWGVAGMRNHSPDVSVFVDVANPPEGRIGTYHVAVHGGRPVLLLEIVSPDRRDIDVERKFADYRRLGVPIYAIVDQERDDGPRTLRAYRLAEAGYEPIEADDQGRVLLETVDLMLGMRDDQLRYFDPATGAEIGDYAQLNQQLQAEMDARRAAEDRIRALEEQLRRLQGGTSNGGGAGP